VKGGASFPAGVSKSVSEHSNSPPRLEKPAERLHIRSVRAGANRRV
jgi:hypothetical protein